jgi:carboxyl-terminal processing protease
LCLPRARVEWTMFFRFRTTISPIRMSLRRFLRTLPLLTVSLLMPVAILAAGTASVLATPDAASVSRGDFLRASIQTLHTTLQNDVTLQYRVPVPVSLQPYVKTALYDNALPFGNDLNLGQKITRGEAIQILVGLMGIKPHETYRGTYQDVTGNISMQHAVEVALENEWLVAQSNTTFGVNLSLNGADARVLLAAAALTALPSAPQTSSLSSSVTISNNSSSAPTISVNLPTTQPTVQIPGQQLLQTIWQLLNNQYLYTDKLNNQEAGYSAAEKMVESLNDPYTMFLRPLPAQEFQDQIGGQITGIGAQVEYKENILTIVAPISGSPAEKAGLKPGDKVLAADGVDITNIGFLEAVNKIRGPKGSSVKLHIDRGGVEMDVSVMRDTITLPEIDVSYQGSIAVVKLSQFGETTDRDLRSILTEVATHHPTAFILDLRNNPGGLLHAADEVVSNFVPSGSTVAHIMARDGESIESTQEAPTIDASVPMVVLVNGGSASAAEITAGALQDYKRAIIVGEQSYGKGTVQQILQFRDGSELKMTIAEWLTPLKRKINKIGVTPDYIVPANDAQDDQMLKALSLLR